MPYRLFLLFFFFHHSTTFITTAYSTNNSSINIDLYQCNTNVTILNVTTTIDTIFNNLPYSCSINCCTSSSLNNTTSANLCQVTVQSSTGDCLGRLCYSGECDKFTSLANITHDDSKMKNTTTIINELYSSIINSTQIEWFSWVGKTDFRHTIIIILLIVNISLTLMTLIIVIKSIRQANNIAEEKAYRYTLL